jgi:hypothetical protein
MTFPMMASKGRVLQWSAAFVLSWAAPAHAADYSGHVVSILDGDTIEVLNGHYAERIRLSNSTAASSFSHSPIWLTDYGSRPSLQREAAAI